MDRVLTSTIPATVSLRPTQSVLGHPGLHSTDRVFKKKEREKKNIKSTADVPETRPKNVTSVLQESLVNIQCSVHFNTI